MKPTRCCICKGYHQIGELKDMMFVEPTDEENSSPQYIRGWMCEECVIVHWASPSEDWWCSCDKNHECEGHRV